MTPSVCGGKSQVRNRSARVTGVRDRAPIGRTFLDALHWWEMRSAQSRQAKTYECPICHGLLLAINPNTLLFPERDRECRRHVHTICLARQRKAGKLLTKAEGMDVLATKI